jgi:hypothetical protein
VFNIVWSLVQPFLEERTKAKFSFGRMIPLRVDLHFLV